MPRPGAQRSGRWQDPGSERGPDRGPDRAADRAPDRGPDPLAGVERVLVDGTNLAFALAGRGAAAPTPAAGVLASVRAVFPPAVRVELVFDGSGDVGIARSGTLARAAQNLFVEHSGRRSADRVIEQAVEARLRTDGPAGTWGILVVTDDRELRDLVQGKGARVAGTAWLAGRLARANAGAGAASNRPSGTSIGHRRPPRPARPPSERC